MIALAKSETECRDKSLHDKFMVMLPVIVRSARVAFRNLTPEAREEATQETTAAAWAAFRRLAHRSKLDVCFPSVLAMYSVKQTRAGRKLGSRLNIRDVMSAYSRHCKGYHLERLDCFDQEENSWKEIVLEDKRSTPADVGAFRLDFSAWLELLPSRYRRIATALAGGETTKNAAKEFCVSPGRISQLRLWLKASWERFQGESKADEPTRLAVA